MGEIFHEQRDRLDHLDDPELSEVALRETIIRIRDSGLSPEDQEALIGEAKAESLMFGLNAEQADRIQNNALTGYALDHLITDLTDRIREIKENQPGGEQ